MNTYKKFDNDFRISSVKIALSANQSYEKTAQELGIPRSTLYGWIRNYKRGQDNLADKSPLSDQQKALKNALSELQIVREERDILKKALGIFSLPKNK